MTDTNAVVKKKEDTYDWYKFSMWIGSIILAINGLGLLIWDNLDDVWAASLLLGLSGFLPYFFTYIGMQKPVKDERARKIGTAASAYSWYVTLCVLCFTGILGYFLHLDIGMARLLGIAILTMIISMLASSVILGRKGDIE